jgi:hypothetical protein
MSMREGLGAAPSNLTVPLTEEGVSAGELQPDGIHMESASAASAHAEVNENFNFIQSLLS